MKKNKLIKKQEVSLRPDRSGKFWLKIVLLVSGSLALILTYFGVLNQSPRAEFWAPLFWLTLLVLLFV